MIAYICYTVYVGYIVRGFYCINVYENNTRITNHYPLLASRYNRNRKQRTYSRQF